MEREDNDRQQDGWTQLEAHHWKTKGTELETDHPKEDLSV